MNTEFENFYEFNESTNMFLSKDFYKQRTINGKELKIKYFVSPYLFKSPKFHSFLENIKNIAKKISNENYNSNLGGLERFLFSTSYSDFPTLISDGHFDENISSEFEKLKKINFFEEKNIYFNIRYGCISYDFNGNEGDYFLKWIARIPSFNYVKPNLEFIDLILNKNLRLNNEFFSFQNNAEDIDRKEIIKTFSGVLSAVKNTRYFYDATNEILDNLSKDIVQLLFMQYYLIGFGQSLSEKSFYESLNQTYLDKIQIH